MRILMHTMACPDRDVAGALTLAHDLGLDGIELICQDGLLGVFLERLPHRTAGRMHRHHEHSETHTVPLVARFLGGESSGDDGETEGGSQLRSRYALLYPR